MIKKSLYHIALNSQGYVLAGSPQRPARKMEKAPVFGTRFASGDRDETDFSFWWYWKQTDWYGGIKKKDKWEDDAKYQWGHLVDTWSEPGIVKIAKPLSATITLGTTPGDYAGQINRINTGGSTYKIYTFTKGDDSGTIKAGFWDESGTNKYFIPTANGTEPGSFVPYDVRTDGEIIWATNTYLGRSPSPDFSGTEVPDFHAINNSGSTRTPLVKWGDYIYYKYSNDNLGRLTYDSSGSTWVFTDNYYEFNSGSVYLNALELSQGYLWIGLSNGKLYYCDGADTPEVKEFYDFKKKIEWLKDYHYKLYVKIEGDNRVYRVDIINGIVEEVFEIPPSKNPNNVGLINDSYQNSVFEHKGFLCINHNRSGGIIGYNDIDNRLYNIYATDEDDANLTVSAVYSDNDIIYYNVYDSLANTEKLYKVNFATTNNLATTSAYLYYSEFDGFVAGIDKLWHELTINFSELANSGDYIKIYYSTDSGSSYTLLDTIDYDTYGAISSKNILFSSGTVSKKIKLKLELYAAQSTSNIRIKDTWIKFLPIPDYKYQWKLILNCVDDIMLLDGETKEPKRGEERRGLLRKALETKQTINFEDIDYAETKLNGDITDSNTEITVDSTANFPEQGRIRIDNEEIKYTGKTATKFTGCTRGARGTTAVSHNDNTTVDNIYKVIVTDYEENVIVSNNSEIDEYNITVTLMET